MFIHPLFPQPLPLPLPHPFFPNDAFLVFVRPGRDDCLIFYKWGKPLSSQSCMLCCVYYTGLSEPGARGAMPPPQFLADKLTLWSTRGQIMPTQLLSVPPPDFHTFLRPCVYYYDVVVLLWGKKMGWRKCIQNTQLWTDDWLNKRVEWVVLSKKAARKNHQVF